MTASHGYAFIRLFIYDGEKGKIYNVLFLRIGVKAIFSGQVTHELLRCLWYFIQNLEAHRNMPLKLDQLEHSQ